ncbi:YdcF family protein [Sphingobium lactosutens]|uniref:YdcF family protein n=1 Tax=Sphingobium lactosutens TaxID=522773 RepID=UPI0015BB9AC8|nr:YdcF family protein [Sphingobium lactosutens]NWK97026.1 YdcF family protein [Sphingobium lactosutens]
MLGRSLMLAATMVVAASQPASAGVARDAQTEALSQQLFPLLGTLGRSAQMVEQVRAQPALAATLAARAARVAACADAAACIAHALLWSDAERTALDAAIATSARAPLERANILADDGIAGQLRREIAGLNAIIATYALGEPSRYPTIDGPSVPVDSQEAKVRLQAAVALSGTPREGSAQTLDRSVELALALLDVNDRTDAIGFEPIDDGLNAAPMAHARRVNWKRYRYSAIILTGIGPEVLDMPLSPGGKYHVRLAANRFADGDAPFIIVSGGRAHPRGAMFAEAIEMRRALIDRYGVPPEAIVIEPYARHTTTNLRNATRRLMALGAPLDREALIVCNMTQSAYVESPLFADRNLKELGYQPGRIGQRLSPTELLFRPDPVSARVDPLDPLDP